MSRADIEREYPGAHLRSKSAAAAPPESIRMGCDSNSDVSHLEAEQRSSENRLSYYCLTTETCEGTGDISTSGVAFLLAVFLILSLMTPSLRRTECSSSVRINLGRFLNALAFSPNGKYLVSGGTEGVQVWRVADGQSMATMLAPYVRCVSVSRNNKCIAAGTYSGELFVWDAQTYRKILSREGLSEVHGVDFSPDSTRLVAVSANGTASVWDIATSANRATIYHEGVLGAKYSPHGDRLATASPSCVRLYDTKNRHLLVEHRIKATGWFNSGLLWSNTHLFLVSEGKIKQIEVSTGSVVSEWLVPGNDDFGRIALPTHGEFIAHCTSRTLMFWNASTHAQLGRIEHNRDICSFALSPDDRFLAIGEKNGEISIKCLSCITEPAIQIDDVALDLWKHGRLERAEELLTASIPESRDSSHSVLAGRALLRAHLPEQWDTAITDAEQSIKIQPSVLGFIAKSVALVRLGKKPEAYRACDIAFKLSHSAYISFILLIKAIIVCMAGEHEDAISRVADLIETLHFNSLCHTVQAYMYLDFGDSQMAKRDYEGAIDSFKQARNQLVHHASQPPLVISLISGWKFEGLSVTLRQRLCEALYIAGRMNEEREYLLQMLNTTDDDDGDTMANWVSDFTRRCLSTPQSEGASALDATQPQLLLSSLNSTATVLFLGEWAKATLASRTWMDTLESTVCVRTLCSSGILMRLILFALEFNVPRFTIYRVLCERLEIMDHIVNATECLLQMMDELGEQMNVEDEQAEWVLGFKLGCVKKLEGLADTAMSAERYDDAISLYWTALSLDPSAPQGLLIKRSKAYLAIDQWEDALNDANQVTILDPSSPAGYEARHTALHKAGDYENAIIAFEMMLSRMSQSPDMEIREQARRYMHPEDTKAAIRDAIQIAISKSPTVLINTTSGRLCDKSEQAAAFESFPVFAELISATTTSIDRARIEQVVAEYYRYATFSHKWEDKEPLFKDILHIVVYNLEDSPTHNKLQAFCKTVQDAGFHWAWSDTCCIDRTNHFVLQEAIVAMFKWYQGSALTIIFLRGVRFPPRRGDLAKSTWNTRAWTFQEYHASQVVRFYTEDWRPYLDLDIPNHKNSPDIIWEMEQATGLSAPALMSLRPGFDDIREKLRLASQRHTALVEDAAYSLLGIFSVTLPVVYGEGDQALGRLLAQLLTSAGDTSILAWTGRSGSFNSCLPTGITVFNQSSITHIPPAIKGTQMEAVTSGLQASSLSLTSVMELYDRLNGLPVACFVGQRLKLPCIKFKLGSLSTSRGRSGYIFRTQTPAIGVVEIKTEENLSRFDSLFLIHPWIDFLLDRQPVVTGAELENIPDQWLGTPPFDGPSDFKPTVPQNRASRLLVRFLKRSPSHDSASSPSSVSQPDRHLRALRLLARLRQPFGALLLTPNLGGVSACRRVAADSVVTVRIEEITSTTLTKLADRVRILDVL